MLRSIRSEFVRLLYVSLLSIHHGLQLFELNMIGRISQKFRKSRGIACGLGMDIIVLHIMSAVVLGSNCVSQVNDNMNDDPGDAFVTPLKKRKPMKAYQVC